MTVGEIWGYTVAGLFRDQADIDSSAIHDFVQASDKVTRPGQVKIADLDGNGFIDPGNFAVDDHGDLRIIGNQSPRYRYGVNLSAPLERHRIVGLPARRRRAGLVSGFRCGHVLGKIRPAVLRAHTEHP